MNTLLYDAVADALLSYEGLNEISVKIYRGGFNVDKSKAYKNLVERAKKQYPVYDSKVKVTDADKQKTADYAATFSDKQKFLDALKSKGITWNECASDKGINYMRAKMALNTAIACGFDPNDVLALFAPVVNGINICDEINLYTYWQGFDYAERMPKIKYLLVAQDWGNFFNADAEPFKAAVEKMNAGEKIFYPFSLKSTTDKNLIELFKILDRDITKPCDDVFFTNFCLGYRLGNEGGGMGIANRSFKKQCNDWAKISDNTPLDDPIEWCWKNPANEDALVENTRLAVAVASSFNELDGKKSWDNFIAALSLCSKAGGYVLVPVYSDSETFRPGDFQFSFMENTDGENVLEIFATRADISRLYSVHSGKAKVLFIEMREFFKKFLDGEIPCKELLLNIRGANMALSRETILSLQ